MKAKNNNGKQSYILTRETLGMTVLLFCSLITIMLLSNKLIFSSLGSAICTFMYGTFGYGSFLVVAALAYFGFWLVFEKRIKCSLKVALSVFALTLSIFLLFHAVSTRNSALNGYGAYLSDCYVNAERGYAGYTFGGVISGLLVYPLAKGTTFIGAYVIFAILTVLFGYLTFLAVRNAVLGEAVRNAVLGETVAKSAQNVGEEIEQSADEEDKKSVDRLYSVNENFEIISTPRAQAQHAPNPEQRAAEPAAHNPEADDEKENSRRILFEQGEFAAESYRRNLIYNENSYFNHPVYNESDYRASFTDGKSSQVPPPKSSYVSDYSERAESGAQQPAQYQYGDKPVESFGVQQPQAVEPKREELPREPIAEAPEIDSYTVTGRAVEQPTVNEEQVEDQPAFRERESEEFTVRRESVEPRELNDGEQARGGSESFPRFEEEPPVRSEQPVRGEMPAEEPAPDPARGERDFRRIFSADNPRQTENIRIEPDTSALDRSRRERSRENIFDDDADDIFSDSRSRGLRPADDPAPLDVRAERRTVDEGNEGMVEQPRDGALDARGRQGETQPVRSFGLNGGELISRRGDNVPEVQPAEEQEPEKPKHVWKKYVRPTLDLLDDYPENNNVNTAEIEESKQVICDTLAGFRISGQVTNVVVGPAITRYDVVIEDKTQIKNALKYRESIAMALMKDNVNAYLNYSKGAISIEVPNSKRTIVGLKTMLASSQFLNSKPNTLAFALGKNVEGQVVCPDITKMPHLLVAGTTGSGKSICLSALIVSLLYKYGPEELRFILVDPKQVEFISYDKLPHLMINEIIYDVDKSIKALNWAIKEMERRYALFKEMTEKGIATKSLNEYNAHLPEGEEKLPKIVIILDEFGDLMMQAKKDIETRIIRLVQKARACGIHLILATQRPSVDCITGLIKSNLPTRIGFKVNSFDDARCIFDIGGAEKLLGKGDLYFRSAENPELARVQGCFIDTHEVQKVTDYVKAHNETYFDQSVSDFINTVEEPAETPAEDGAQSVDTKIDDTFIKALKFCVTSNQASVSMIQRRFPIGYMKACKIIDWMENMNYITQSEGSKPRKVLLSAEEFSRVYGDIDD